MQTSNGLLVQLKAPRERDEDQMASAVLEVESVTCALRVNGQKFNLARIPPLNRTLVIQRLRLRIATFNLRQLLLKLVHQERIRMLVHLS